MNNTLDKSDNINSNKNLESNFEIDFNSAVELTAKSYSYAELITFLKSDKVVEKQMAVLHLDKILSKEDALLLVSNLVGQDGKIREAVAFKCNELVQNQQYLEFFLDENVFNLFLQGIMDINGNVCRQIVTAKWFETDIFKKYISTRLPESIRELLVEIDKIDQMSKQYVISKRNFQLYWCLEALFNIIEAVDLSEIKDILAKTAEFYDYTIREKAAKILSVINDQRFDNIRQKLINDENYYVRRYLV